MYDVIIIGAGIVGTTISRELSKYLGRFLVLEKHNDVSCGTTKEVQSTPDSYVAEGETLPAIEENADVAAAPQQAKKTKKKKNAIEDFFTFGNKDDYIIYDNTTVFAKEITGMKEKNAKRTKRIYQIMDERLDYENKSMRDLVELFGKEA